MPNSVEITPYANSVTVEAVKVETTWYWLSPYQAVPKYKEAVAA